MLKSYLNLTLFVRQTRFLRSLLGTKINFMEQNMNKIQMALTNHVTDTDKKIDGLKISKK